MKKFGFLKLLFVLLLCNSSCILSGNDTWVLSRAADCFVNLGLHTIDGLVGRADFPLGEFHIFFKILYNLKFGFEKIPNVDERWTRNDNASPYRSWRMWEYLAALVISSAFAWPSPEEYVNKASKLSPHYRWTTNDQYGDRVAMKFQEAIGSGGVDLLKALVKKLFNKYITVMTKAKALKVGVQAKIQLIEGTEPINSSKFVKIESIEGKRPLYISVCGNFIAISTDRAQPGTRAADTFGPLVGHLYKSFFAQNSFVLFNGAKLEPHFDGSSNDLNHLKGHYGTLILQTGNLIKGLSDPDAFANAYMCKDEAQWDTSWYNHNIFQSNYGWNRGGRGYGDNNGYKNAEVSWLTFGGDGFTSPLTGKMGNMPWMCVDSPLLGVDPSEKIFKITGKPHWFVYTADGQPCRTDGGPGLLRYRDACYDFSGGINVMAIIPGSDNDTKNVATDPTFLQIKKLSGAAGRAGISDLDLNAKYPNPDTNMDQVNQAVEQSRNAGGTVNSSVFSDAPYLGVPKGEKQFNMVEVGLDDSVWALCDSGMPYLVKDGKAFVPMISQFQPDLKFLKIQIGATAPHKALGITSSGDIYLLLDPELKLWQSTGLKGTHASVDNKCNMAIVGLDGAIYRLALNSND